MFYQNRFTERARQALTLAQEAAASFGHSYIGSEHLLLGLLREGGGPAADSPAHRLLLAPVGGAGGGALQKAVFDQQAAEVGKVLIDPAQQPVDLLLRILSAGLELLGDGAEYDQLALFAGRPLAQGAGFVKTGGQDGLPLLISNGVAGINHGRSGMGVAKAGIHRAGDAAGAQ